MRLSSKTLRIRLASSIPVLKLGAAIHGTHT